MPLSAASARAVSKHFGATRALDNVLAGEVHTLVGENGAGKSTLVRVLGGVHRPDSGEIAIHGQACRFQPPARCHRGRGDHDSAGAAVGPGAVDCREPYDQSSEYSTGKHV